MVIVLKNGGEDMATNIKSLIYTQDYVDAATNTKEEYEVLNGLFQGNYAFEERKSLRDVKVAKIIDMI